MADSTNNDIQTAQVIPSFFNEFEGTVEEFKELLADLERVDATEEDKKLLDEINRGQVFIYTTDPNKPGEREGIAIYTRGAFFNTEGGDANDFISSDKSINIAQEGKKIDLTVNSETVKLGDGEGNDQSIKVTNPIGNLKMNDVLGEDLNLLELLKKMLQQTYYPEKVNDPAITITENLKGTYEVGDKITGQLGNTPIDGKFKGKTSDTGEWNAEATFNAGCEWSNIVYGGQGVDTATGKVDYQTTKDETLTFTVSGDHTASKPIQDSVGGTYKDIDISAGTKTNSCSVSVKYKYFYGVKTRDDIKVPITNKDDINALIKSGLSSKNQGEGWCSNEINITTFNTTKEYPSHVLILPVGYEVTYIEGDLGPVPQPIVPNTLEKQKESCTYSNNGTDIEYNIFYGPWDIATNFKNIKIKKIK